MNQLEIPLSNFLSDAKSGQIPTAPPNEDVSKYQKAAMEKATISLLTATEQAVNSNAGYRAVSIVPGMREGHPIADVTLLLGETFKNVVENLE